MKGRLNLEKLEISSKEFYIKLEQLADGVNKIQTELEVLKTSILHRQTHLEEKIRKLEESVDELDKEQKAIHEKISLRDRVFVTSFISVVFFGIIFAMIAKVLGVGGLQ